MKKLIANITTMLLVEQGIVAALQPGDIIILVTGAGSVFKQVLVNSGAGRTLAQFLTAAGNAHNDENQCSVVCFSCGASTRGDSLTPPPHFVA